MCYTGGVKEARIALVTLVLDCEGGLVCPTCEGRLATYDLAGGLIVATCEDCGQRYYHQVPEEIPTTNG